MWKTNTKTLFKQNECVQNLPFGGDKTFKRWCNWIRLNSFSVLFVCISYFVSSLSTFYILLSHSLAQPNIREIRLSSSLKFFEPHAFARLQRVWVHVCVCVCAPSICNFSFDLQAITHACYSFILIIFALISLLNLKWLRLVLTGIPDTRHTTSNTWIYGKLGECETRIIWYISFACIPHIHWKLYVKEHQSRHTTIISNTEIVNGITGAPLALKYIYFCLTRYFHWNCFSEHGFSID